jgi:hypothetical protein
MVRGFLDRLSLRVGLASHRAWRSDWSGHLLLFQVDLLVASAADPEKFLFNKARCCTVAALQRFGGNPSTSRQGSPPSLLSFGTLGVEFC